MKQESAEKILPGCSKKPLWFCGECGLGGYCLHDLIRHVADEHGLESWGLGGGVSLRREGSSEQDAEGNVKACARSRDGVDGSRIQSPCPSKFVTELKESLSARFPTRRSTVSLRSERGTRAGGSLGGHGHKTMTKPKMEIYLGAISGTWRAPWLGSSSETWNCTRKIPGEDLGRCGRIIAKPMSTPGKRCKDRDEPNQYVAAMTGRVDPNHMTEKVCSHCRISCRPARRESRWIAEKDVHHLRGSKGPERPPDRRPAGPRKNASRLCARRSPEARRCQRDPQVLLKPREELGGVPSPDRAAPLRRRPSATRQRSDPAGRSKTGNRPVRPVRGLHLAYQGYAAD